MTRALGGGVERQVVVESADHQIYTVCRAGIFGMNLNVVLHPERYNGSFLMANWERSRSKALARPDNARNKPAWDMVPTIYAAYRRTLHILHGYGIDIDAGEKKMLIAARETALQLNLSVLGMSKEGSVGEYRRRLNVLVMRIADPLMTARKESKVQARDHMLSTLVDLEKESPNMPATRARTIAVRNRLKERTDEIMAIEPRILGLQQVLLSLRSLAELSIETTSTFLDALLKNMELVHVMRRRRAIADHLELLAQDLDQIDFNPYREMCGLTVANLRVARDVLRKTKPTDGDYGQFEQELQRCQTAIKIKNVQVDIERLILRLLKVEQRNEAMPAIRFRDMAINIIHKLEAIDDSDLKQPVVRQSLTYMEDAANIFASYETKLLGPVKSALRMASAKL